MLLHISVKTDSKINIIYSITFWRKPPLIVTQSKFIPTLNPARRKRLLSRTSSKISTQNNIVPLLRRRQYSIA